jgi:hypothetical protein
MLMSITIAVVEDNPFIVYWTTLVLVPGHVALSAAGGRQVTFGQQTPILRTYEQGAVEPVADELAIIPPTLDHNVRDAERQRSIAPRPHSSIDTASFGLSKARLKRSIQINESDDADVEGEDALNTALSGPYALASWRSREAIRSSTSSQLICCQPGSRSPFGRVRFSG